MIGYILALFSIISLVVAFIIEPKTSNDVNKTAKENKLINIFGLFLLLGAIGFCGSIIMFVSDSNASYSKDKVLGDLELVNTSELAAMDNSEALHGQMALSFGYLSQDNTYAFLCNTDDGGYKKVSLNSDTVTVYETNSNYRLEEYKSYYYYVTKINESKRKYFKIFWREPVDNHEEKEKTRRLIEPDSVYRAYVPKGSIVSDYSVMG